MKGRDLFVHTIEVVPSGTADGGHVMRITFVWHGRTYVRSVPVASGVNVRERLDAAVDAFEQEAAKQTELPALYISVGKNTPDSEA